MTVNLDLPIFAMHIDSGDVLAVKVLERAAGGDYPIITLVGEDLDDPDDQEIVRFSLDGESRKGKHTLANVVEKVVEPVSADDAATSGKVVVPADLLKVGHSRYGIGTVLKVRQHDSKSFYVTFPGGTKKWVLNRKLYAAA